MRKNCHKPATSVLHSFFRSYQNISFHQESQKFALGIHKIIVYDLRTAVKWREFDGHKKEVNCLSFNQNGKFIASFCIEESQIKIWKLGEQGFFGALLGSGKHYKQIKIPREMYMSEEE